MQTAPVLIAGQWAASAATKTFQATNPKTCEPLPIAYPISPWAEIKQAIASAAAAFEQLCELPPERRAEFLERFAERISARSAQLVATAAEETGLPAEPRLTAVELPRTVNQLKLAAAAARERSWCLPTIDAAANIRSMLFGIGPVCVFGPNNFPFAFNSVAGGDFAAAIAAGNPVIGKANSSHPGTSRLLTEEAQAAADETGMPAGTVQLIYRTDHADGERLVSHPAIGATGYTGSRSAGLALKRSADATGKPIYLELSSINPVVMLPGALRERADALAGEFATSCLMGTGQFCTNPGLVLLIAGPETDAFVASVAERFTKAPAGVLLSGSVLESLAKGVASLVAAGAQVIAGGKRAEEKSFSFANTLLKAAGKQFLKNPHALQAEAFGNESLFVVCDNLDELCSVLGQLEGNLTGCVYSHTKGDDDEAYRRIEPILRQKVGRLLNDKMPTGVAVSPAMNHGGPYPATGHAGFTAVGIPASLRRFAVLTCFDSVRPERLPPELRNQNLPNRPWRFVNGAWTRDDVG